MAQLENYFLAYICNDVEHLSDYRVDEMGFAYYREDLIGKILIGVVGGTGNVGIKFQPYKPIEHIDIKITIHKP